MFTLYPHQSKMIDDDKVLLKKGYRSICNQLPCGGGKSVIAAHIAKMATDKGSTVLFVVHRNELCKQIHATFEICGVNMTLCHVGMIVSIANRIGKIPRPDLLIIDEAHHAVAATYKKVIEWANCILIGFTATPIRTSKHETLADIFQVMVCGPTVKWLKENKFLAMEKCYSLSMADMSQIGLKYGDYDKRAMALTFEHEQIYCDTVKAYEKYALGKKTIIYNVSVKSAKETAEAFCRKGFIAAHVSEKTPKKERSKIVEAFRKSEIQILTNAEIFGEGFDLPDCDCVMLLRKTTSLIAYIQMSMRCMRWNPHNPEKVALILDCAGNIIEHGLPDEDREYSLTMPEKKGGGDAPVKVCEKCECVNYASVMVCCVCGYEFPQKEKVVVDVSNLRSVDEATLLRNKPYSYVDSIKTWDELVAFQRARKYKFSWNIFTAARLGILIPVKYQWYIENILNSAIG